MSPRAFAILLEIITELVQQLSEKELIDSREILLLLSVAMNEKH